MMKQRSRTLEQKGTREKSVQCGASARFRWQRRGEASVCAGHRRRLYELRAPEELGGETEGALGATSHSFVMLQ